MEPISKIIPARIENEKPLIYARRLKKLGFLPSAIMEPGLYGIARKEQHEEQKAFIENLKAEHKCLTCKGEGAVLSGVGGVFGHEYEQCSDCAGLGLETAKYDDLAQQEKDFLNALTDYGVYKNKLTPENIHRAFWYCQYKKIYNMDKMIKVFLGRIHSTKQGNYLKTVCEFEPAWIYSEKEKTKGKDEDPELKEIFEGK
jgi:hypothetical protein